MHEKERQRIILSLVQSRPVATVQDLVDMTGASEATIRRDIAALHVQAKLRRVRGGAEAIAPPSQTALMGRPYKGNYLFLSNLFLMNKDHASPSIRLNLETPIPYVTIFTKQSFL